MSDGAALREAVVASPDDDTPRLVYADWLDENDDHQLAGFVRDSVQLARTPVADASYPALLARVRRAGLFTKPSRKWVDHIPGAKVMFRRGFVAGVDIDASRYLKHKPEEWDRVPVEQLALTRPEKPATNLNLGQALVARRDLARVRTLCFRNRWTVAELEPLLCGCSHLAGLRALRLGRYDWSAWDGEQEHRLSAFGSKLRLPALESLHLHEPFSDEMWRGFVEGLSRPLRRVWLETYTESADWWDAHGYEWLRTTKHWPTLEYAQFWHGVNYTWSGSWETPARVNDMAGVFTPGKLTSLAINAFWDFDALLKVPDWGALRTLCLSYNHSDETDVTALAHAPQAKNIERLALRTGADPDEEHQEFIRGACLPNVRELSLTPQNPILLNGPYREQLVRLSTTNYSGVDWVATVANTALPELRTFELVWGYGGNPPLKPLFTTKNLPNLCTLLLTDRDTVTPRELAQLATNPNLPHLSLVGVGSFGVKVWYVLANGKGKKVANGINPTDTDWWDEDLLCRWL